MVLEEILDKIGIDNKEFQKTFDHYVSNQDNHEQINAAKDDAEIDRQEGIPKSQRKPKEATMDRKEIFAAQKKMQDLSLEAIKELKAMPPMLINDEIKYL